MKKTMVIFAAVLALATSSQAVKLGAETQSLDLSGSYDFEDSYRLRAGYGFFIMDYLEIGGLLNIQSSDSVTAFGFGPKAEYNFELDLPGVVPFAGSALTFQHANIKAADDVTNALNLDVYGGVKFFLTDQFAITTSLILSAATSAIYERREAETHQTNARLDLGLRYYF